jgi:hypothetical protein
MLVQAGLLDDDNTPRKGDNAVEAAIRADDRLSEDAKRALITVYRGMLSSSVAT